MADQIILAPSRALDANADPVTAGRAYFYRSGTMTAETVTNSVGTALPWPLEADIDGVFPQAFYAGSYALKVVITDPDDVVLVTIDPAPRITTAPTEAADIAFTPTDEAPASNVQDAIEALGDYAAGIEARQINTGGLASGGGALTADVTVTVTAATEAEARAGVNNAKAMTPALTKAAIETLTPLGLAYSSPVQTITSAALLTLPHGLPSRPKLITVELICGTAELNFAIGDVVLAGLNGSTAGTTRANAVWSDATNVYVRFSDETSCFLLADKTTGAAASITNSYWTLFVRAFA